VLKSLKFYNTAGSHLYMIVMRWNEDKHFHNTIPFRQSYIPAESIFVGPIMCISHGSM
jgi:hypothetical protein